MTRAAYTILPPRAGETDEEKRLREAIDRQAGQIMSTVDSALALRTAAGPVKQARHVALANLRSFALQAMHAQALAADLRD